MIRVLDWVLDMKTHFKVFASYNILQNLCDFIHVLIFVIVSKRQKNPKLTNIVIYLISVWYDGVFHICVLNSHVYNSLFIYHILKLSLHALPRHKLHCLPQT